MDKTRDTKIAVLTVSDGVTLGIREDLSGKLALGILEAGLHPDILTGQAVPDDLKQIADTLRAWADEGYRLIVTSGGTGISPRDNTPQATLSVIDYVVPGIAELMRSESLKKTVMAALSRAVAGVRGRTLIINLPGSPKGVEECLSAVMPILPHAIEQLESGAGHTK
ncbi:MAG: MogA/MoaB family molybdenum cofactor biosynthesis protein [Chloroflexota bacterium]